jgi:hypothetical protein
MENRVNLSYRDFLRELKWGMVNGFSVGVCLTLWFTTTKPILASWTGVPAVLVCLLASAYYLATKYKIKGECSSEENQKWD